MSTPQREGYLAQIELGSAGKLYDGLIPDGILLCEPWSSTEEMLLNSGLNAHLLLDQLITNCCRLPQGLTPEDLTASDRFQIFFHLRNITYPHPYHYSFRCSECGKKASITMDLMRELRIRYLGREPLLDAMGEPTDQYRAVDFAEPIQLKLPVCGSMVGWRYLRGKDEKAIERYEKRMKTKNPDMTADVGYQYRMALHLVSLEGVELKVDEALDFIRDRKRFTGADSLALRNDFDAKAHGVIPRVEPECNHCRYPNGPFVLPFDESFFRPGEGRVQNAT